MAKELDIKTIITFVSFIALIVGGGIAYGELKNQVKNTDQDLKVHCVNQTQSDKVQYDNNKELAINVAKLSQKTEDLQKSIDRLIIKLDHAR